MNKNGDFVAKVAHTYPAGIDKLIIHTKEFEVKDIFNLGIAPNYKKQGQDEIEHQQLFICSGQQIYGSKAFHNAGEELGNLSLTIDWRGLSMAWNPSKLAGKYTGELASPQDANNGVKIIQDYVSEMGVLTNVSSAKFTRWDNAKDRQMSNKVFAYRQALGWIEGKRMKEQVQYPDGMRIGNKQKQTIFYDKGLELCPDSGRSNNMRCEMRLLNSDSVQRVMNISHVHQLKDYGQDDLSKIYSGFLTKNVFKIGDFGQMSFDFMNEVNILRSFRKQGHSGFEKWLMLHGVEKVSALCGADSLKQILQEAGFDRFSVRRCIQKMNKLLQMSSFLKNDEQTAGKMFEEIRQKFAS